jgi:hypothetical protein
MKRWRATDSRARPLLRSRMHTRSRMHMRKNSNRRPRSPKLLSLRLVRRVRGLWSDAFTCMCEA